MAEPQPRKLQRLARLRWIRLGDMRVSALAQREFRQSHADEIARDFDPERMETPTVNHRDGFFYIVSGQHRIAACEQWLGEGWENEQIQCWTYDGMSEQEEADQFLLIGNTLNIPAFEKYRIAVFAGRERESDIDRIVRAQGLRVSKSRDTDNPGSISAVGALSDVYDRGGPEALGRALRIAFGAWNQAGLEAAIIRGLGMVCQVYEGDLHKDVVIAERSEKHKMSAESFLIDRLGTVRGGTQTLMEKANTIRRQYGQKKTASVAAAIVDLVNRGKGGPKLTPWLKKTAEAV